MKKRKANRIRRKIIFFLISVILIVGLLILYVRKEDKFMEFDMYVSSKNNLEMLYDANYNGYLKGIRGTKVRVIGKEIYNEEEYYKINYKGEVYSIKPSSLTDNVDDIVLEKTMYVRTPITIYENSVDSKIAGFAKKGTKLEIVGYDKLNQDGNVNMYNIKLDEIEGFVFAKYLVDNLDSSLENYDEENIYAYHKDRKYSYDLYGGSAKNLDYYPYEKTTFDDNLMPEVTNTLYLNASTSTLEKIDDYIELAKDTRINAFVVDIKDGSLAYESSVAKIYMPTGYKSYIYKIEKYKEIIDKIKSSGFYVIGRIVVFNDYQFAKDNADECIKTESGAVTTWVSAYSRKAWQYNVELAIEAIELFDFNEIQFDYVRFPEKSYNWSKNNYDFANVYDEEKAQAIQNFLFYATDQIHKYNTYISADVFGESSYTYVSAYGQYWPAISNIVDVISGMPYTDHFDKKETYWKNPYKTVYDWAKTAAARQKEIPTPAKVRTWITAYDTPNWNPTVVYDAEKIYDQIKALNDAGLINGCLAWNGKSSYSKYSSIISAFGKEKQSEQNNIE